jgi:hypothetical protein
MFERCNKCDAFGKHPFCPLCSNKMHSIGHVVDKGMDSEELDRSAPTRVLTQQRDGITMAFMIPYLAAKGKIPEERAPEVVRRILGLLHPTLVLEAVWHFAYSRMPYLFEVVDADLTGDTMPFMKVRYGYWECRDHKGMLPGDVPARAIERDGGRCIICGAAQNVVVGYMIPLGWHGKKVGTYKTKVTSRTEIGNVATFCTACQKERGDRDYWQFVKAKGFPMDDYVVDFKSGFVRNFIVGGKVRL